MALLVDSEESANAGHNSATSPLSWSFTNTAGTLLCVGVVVSYSNTSSGVSISATYNAVSMSVVSGSPVLYHHTASGFDSYVAMFYLKTPATGANTVSITVSQAGGTLSQIIAGAISFTGASTTPLGTLASSNDAGAGGTTPTVNLTGTTNGDIVLSVVSDGQSLTGATAPTTASATKNVDGNTTGDNMVLGRQTTSGGTVTAKYTTATSDAWNILAVEVFAAVASGGNPFPAGHSIIRVQYPPWR